MGIKVANPTPSVRMSLVTKQLGDAHKVEARYYDGAMVGEHQTGDLGQPVVEFVQGNDGLVRLARGAHPNGGGTVFALDANGKIEEV